MTVHLLEHASVYLRLHVEPPASPAPVVPRPAEALEVFYCDRYKCRLTRAACAGRQYEQSAFLTRANYPDCASGKCAQGTGVLVALGEWRPSQPRQKRVSRHRIVELYCWLDETTADRSHWE